MPSNARLEPKSNLSLTSDLSQICMYSFIISRLRPICSMHVILPDPITLITFSVSCKFYSLQLLTFLQPHVISNKNINILLKIMFSHNLNRCCSVTVRNQISRQYQTKNKTQFIICFERSNSFIKLVENTN